MIQKFLHSEHSVDVLAAVSFTSTSRKKGKSFKICFRDSWIFHPLFCTQNAHHIDDTHESTQWLMEDFINKPFQPIVEIFYDAGNRWYCFIREWFLSWRFYRAIFIPNIIKFCARLIWDGSSNKAKNQFNDFSNRSFCIIGKNIYRDWINQAFNWNVSYNNSLNW